MCAEEQNLVEKILEDLNVELRPVALGCVQDYEGKIFHPVSGEITVIHIEDDNMLPLFLETNHDFHALVHVSLNNELPEYEMPHYFKQLESLGVEWHVPVIFFVIGEENFYRSLLGYASNALIAFSSRENNGTSTIELKNDRCTLSYDERAIQPSPYIIAVKKTEVIRWRNFMIWQFFFISPRYCSTYDSYRIFENNIGNDTWEELPNEAPLWNLFEQENGIHLDKKDFKELFRYLKALQTIVPGTEVVKEVRSKSKNNILGLYGGKRIDGTFYWRHHYLYKSGYDFDVSSLVEREIISPELFFKKYSESALFIRALAKHYNIERKENEMIEELHERLVGYLDDNPPVG